MNYRHGYHAGNFCDVIKHNVLIILLRALAKKQTPFAYLDTHAGSGLYQLESEASQKTAEYKEGIEKLKAYIRHYDSDTDFFKQNSEKIPEAIKTYFNIIHHLSPELQIYPGSVMIAQAILQAQDSLIACELHTEEASKLRKYMKEVETNSQNLATDLNFMSFPKIAIHQQDGYLGLKSFLPFKERRGLILIDPPFEKNTEWQDLLNYIKLAYCRFPQGVYAIWYPIKDQQEVRSFLKQMQDQFSDPKRLGLKNPVQILNVECILDRTYSCMTTRTHKTNYSKSLMGTGMLILNPPWQIEDELEVVINWLWNKMQFSEKGACSIQSLM